MITELQQRKGESTRNCVAVCMVSSDEMRGQER